MDLIKEHDQIVLTADLPKEEFTADDVGTVVHIHREGEAFEVEFMTLGEETIAVTRFCLPTFVPLANERLRTPAFGLNDLEALLTVAREAKEWISAHALKH